MKRNVAGVLIGLVVLAAVSGVAVSVPDGGDSQLSLDELREGGQQVGGDAPASVRLIGGDGAVLVQYLPAKPFASSREPLESGSRLETNTIELRSAWFGDQPYNVTVHLAYWQQGERTVTTDNGTRTEAVATNVTHTTVNAQFAHGYATTEVDLRPHYDDEHQVTMWLAHEGEPVPGARWRFRHKSNPASAGATDIDSQGDLWSWGFMTFVLPGVPGILLGGYGARGILRKTIVGPRKGPVWWAGMAFLAGLAVALVAYYQAAVLLAAAPWLAGVGIATIAFVVYIEAFDADVEEAEFRKKELFDAISPGSVAADGGDGEDREYDSKDSRFEKIAEVDVIRRNGKLYMPKRGLRPFIARFFAEPATVPVDDLNLTIECEGDVDKVFEVDPEAPRVLQHESAGLTFDPTVITPVDDPENPRSLLQRVNWTYLGLTGVGFYVIYSAFATGLGVPGVGVLLGVTPGLVAGTTARSGIADFEPAPVHFSQAPAVLAFERKTLEESKTIEHAEARAARAETETWREARKRRSDLGKTVTERLNEGALGVKSLDTPAVDPGDEDDDRDDVGERREVPNDD